MASKHEGRRLRRPKFSTTRVAKPVLYVALLVFVAVTGAAFAGTKAAKNSVVSSSVKNNALTGKDIKDSSLKGKEVKDSSLKGKDVKDSSLSGADVKDSSLNGADVIDSSLSGADVGNDSLTGADIDEATLEIGAENGPAGGDLTGSYPDPTIKNGVVNSAKIADASVFGQDIANGTVASADITDGSIAGADVAPGAIATGQIANNGVTTTDVLDNSLIGSDIANTSINTADLAPSAINSSRVAGSAIGTAQVANDSLTATDIDESTLPFGRAVRDSNTNSFNVDGDVATKVINVPAGGGILFIVASAQLNSEPGDNGGALINCRIELNGTDIPATERSISIDEANGSECSSNWAQTVAAGNSTVSLEIASLDPQETASNPVLQVMFVPFSG
jgi:uncharacterized protein YjbI with pentapeptide repeats